MPSRIGGRQMGGFLVSFVLPLLLLAAGLLDWNLISMVNILLFFSIRFASPETGFSSQKLVPITCCVIIFSVLVILLQVTFHILWCFEGERWSVANSYWAKLIGLVRDHTWRLTSVIYFVMIQLAAAFVALVEVLCNTRHLHSPWVDFTLAAKSIDYHLRVLCCLLLPSVQLVLGISHPSWISLPFFICSCVGLIDWSLTSNFLGLFRWWRPLLLYACFSILLIYIYQLPVDFPNMFLVFADFIGLYKINKWSDWPELCSGTSLLLYFFMLSSVKYDLQEMDSIMSMKNSSLVEQLLPQRHSFFIQKSRSGRRHANVLLRISVFRNFTINFFTYGFPALLLSLSIWSFNFTSLCSFGLLAYVGFVLFAFPSLVQLHRLNGMLLIFILLWAASTYVFNVAFTFLNKRIQKDMVIWETIGLWHYPIPGLFLLAQFVLGGLLALVNLVNNSVFLYLSDEDGRLFNNDKRIEEKEGTKLDLISEALQHSGSWILVTLSQLGLQQRVGHMDFVELGALVCFCAFQNHGVEMLCSFSAILQRTPCTPLGFSILKDGLKTSVLLSIYNSSSSNDHHCFYTSHEQKVTTYLSKIGETFLSTYHSYGTHVVFLTILCTVYMVTPNYISFGYLFFLLVWLVGRQLLGKTERRFWFPLKVYATLVFIFNYSLSISSNFASWLSKLVDLYPDLGFNPKASLLENVWESLAVLIVMQLYSYERSQRRYKTDESSNISEFSFLGFIKRFLIWHSEKILSVAIFYAALSSISAFGLAYLLGLILCSVLPKASRIPSKIFLVYTGLLVMSEYLFQMWCKLAEMCPDQRLNNLAFFLGYKYYDPGFWGIESGLRGKVLVIVACTLQYNVFHWLKNMPTSLIHKGKWEEPCQLFISVEYSSSCYAEENKSLLYSTIADVSSPSFGSKLSITPDQILNVEKGSENRIGKNSLDNFWGTSKESYKLNKRHILASRKERLEIQKTTLIIYMKFWMENLFKLRGLEIHMIVLLLSSFSVLNAISMIYILCIVTCILLKRQVIRKLWPVFVFIFASILIVEYFAIWRDQFPWNCRTGSIAEFHCCDCWSRSNQHFSFCTRCWLGVIVDDRRMLVSYYLVFIFSSFKLRSDRFSDFSESHTYHQMISQRRSVLVWKDLSFETKSFWTFLDYLRLYCYCHLLDIVLALILIIGTLEYDALHLGYLGFALVFFRMRLEILKKKNMIFKYLRIYNFTVIVLSLAYQSPYLGVFSIGKCEKIDYIYEVIGFHKYDYGFRITSRSALVEIIIFMLVSVQSYVFYSGEFHYVGRHLEAEQVSALLQEQQKRATRKIADLQQISNLEKENQQRNMQVEKIKSDMLNLQVQLSNQNPIQSPRYNIVQAEGLRHRRNFSLQTEIVDWLPDNVTRSPMRKDLDFGIESFRSFDCVPELCKNKKPHVYDLQSSPRTIKSRSSCFADVKRAPDSPCEISDLGYAEGALQWNTNRRENPLVSAVQLIGDGVSQVQSLGNQAVANIASLLNIEPEDLDSSGHSSSDDEILEVKSQTAEYDYFDQMSSVHSGIASASPSTRVQIERIFGFIWSQMRLNNDIVCYCCFVLVFLWNFSVLSMFYLAALFLYALCVNSGPTFSFWLIMLVYTEVNILLQYLYQIVIQHCALSINLPILQKLGFPLHRINASFVISTLPLFLVYISTLLQSSITAKDVEWAPVTEFGYSMQKIHDEKSFSFSNGWKAVVQKSLSSLSNPLKLISRSSSRYWRSITQGSEAPPYFIQLSMEIAQWPDDGIKLEEIESGINELLTIAHEKRCDAENPSSCHSASRVQIQSIERSQENENIAIATLEVIYACPSIGCAPVEWYRSLTPAADVAAEILNSQASMILKEIHFPHTIVSVIGGGKRVVDLSAYIFGVDLAVFFLVAIFYQSVIKNSTKLLDVYQLEDQFPKEFVFILMVLFFLIVLDRIIYLFSFGISRVIFYIFNLLLFTYSVTEYAWCMEPSHKRLELALRVIYLMKSVSLALHALQIRYGIPNKGTLYRQFLTSKVTQIHYMGFRLYRAIPFLYELRCVLDWSCTVTSLTIYDWLKLEDIYASLFLVKCDAHLNRSKHKQGERQCKMTKFCSGICLFLILICVIWAPMLIYSSGNPINIANPVVDASIEIDMKSAGGRLTLYKSSICEKSPWRSSGFYDELVPDHYLDTYDVEDIQLICCQADASIAWIVPSVVQNRYANSIDQNTSIIFTWIFTRERPKGKEVVKYDSLVENCPCLNDVKQVLNGTAASFRTRDAYPKYFHVTSSGEVRALEPVVTSVSGDLYLNHHGNTPWWSFSNIGASDVEGCNGLAGPMAIVISEETPQGLLGETISKFSIWSIYITFVLAVGRFIRLQCSDLRMRIPYENLPSCDRLVAICENIYAARAEGELEVEEILYWTLIKIYRSPHMLFEYTNPD